jgi:hypothetical protein
MVWNWRLMGLNCDVLSPRQSHPTASGWGTRQIETEDDIRLYNDDPRIGDTVGCGYYRLLSACFCTRLRG